ncbi:MAG: VCBS repeat-containing protein [Myxococcales bacterium]|nr:VCBS repeat-containing protein [Myxococcales bacterium]
MNRHALAAIAALLVMLTAPPASAGGALYDLIPGALNPQACGGSGCWTNHLRVTDIDGDGDLDVLLANYPDFFNGSGATQAFAVHTNDGTATFTNASATAVGNFAGSLRQIAVGDVDGDGAVDIYGPSGSGGPHVLFINDGNGVFVDEADVRLPGAPYPQGAAARMGDVDSDGDLDIFAADAYSTNGPPFGHLYVNDGTGTFTEAMGAIPGMITGSDIDDVEFFDADRDFDLDLFVNAHNGGTGALWLNDGTGTFSPGGSVSPPGNSGNHYNAAPCDVDGDGDLDLWIDNIGGGYTEQLLINDGSANFTDETAARVSGNPGTDDNGVICADIDDDGDFDAVVISLGTPERLLVNDGAGNFTYMAGAFPPPNNCSLWGEFGDLNGDGRFDLVTGQGECSSSDEVYLANQGLMPDSRAPLIIAAEDVLPVPPGQEAVIRFAVSDRTVTDEGPRLDRAFVVIDPGGAGTVIDAVYMGGDLYRAVLPASDAGIEAIQVCAEDRNANLGCLGDDPPTGDSSGAGRSQWRRQPSCSWPMTHTSWPSRGCRVV